LALLQAITGNNIAIHATMLLNKSRVCS